MDLPLNWSFSLGHFAKDSFNHQLHSFIGNDCGSAKPTAANSITDSVLAPYQLVEEQLYTCEDSLDKFSYFVEPSLSGMQQGCAFSCEPSALKKNSISELQTPEAITSASYLSPEAPHFVALSGNAFGLERESSSPSLSALVNKLLEETDSEDFMGVPSASLQTESKGWWCRKNDTVGDLAIQLADMAIIDDVKSNETHALKFNVPPRTAPTVPKSERGETASVGTNQRNKVARKKSGFANIPTPQKSNGSRLKEGSEKRMPVGHDNLKKRNSILKPHYQPQGKFRNVRKEAVDMKQTHGPVFKAGGGALQIYPFAFSARNKPGFKKLSSPSTWVHLPTARTDSVSSSSSSLQREPVCTALPLPKFKALSKPNDLEENPCKSSRRPRYSRKTFSSCSSSSSGGRGKYTECVFCKTNGETAATYRSHVLKDEMGRTVCEVLQKYICPLCSATGYDAHTLKYCPKNENPPLVATMTTLKAMRSSTGRKRHGPCSGHVNHMPFGFHRGLLPA